MTRRKLQELTLEELKQLYEKNKQFAAAVAEDIYDNNLRWQEEEYDFIFGQNNDTIEYHSHYNSFYLTIKDHERFIDSLGDTDYLSSDAQALYEKAKQLTERWQNMTTDEQDEHPGVYEELEKANTELLEAIEDDLHTYESVADEQVESELQQITEGENSMGEWGVNDNGIVFEHIEKVYM